MRRHTALLAVLWPISFTVVCVQPSQGSSWWCDQCLRASLAHTPGALAPVRVRTGVRLDTLDEGQTRLLACMPAQAGDAGACTGVLGHPYSTLNLFVQHLPPGA